MTSLAETYGAPGSEARRRLLLGTGLFLAGATMVVAGIVVATTGVLGVFGIGTLGAREIAGVVAGLGVPAVFVGVFSVLPASRRERAAAAIGAGVAVLGVVLFVYAYPNRWIGASRNPLTFPVVAVYFLGAITTFWTLFTAIVDFRARQPGDTVTLQRIIQRASGSRPSGSRGGTPDGSSLGSVGVLGNVDRDGVEEDETDDAELLTDSSGTRSNASNPTASAAPTSDGGSRSEEIRTPRPSAPASTDRYCGNCAHFEYVPTDEGIQPYCDFHEELMDDMEACEEWDPTEFTN